MSRSLVFADADLSAFSAAQQDEVESCPGLMVEYPGALFAWPDVQRDDALLCVEVAVAKLQQIDRLFTEVRHIDPQCAVRKYDWCGYRQCNENDAASGKQGKPFHRDRANSGNALG